jgi:hypothetical protein
MALTTRIWRSAKPGAVQYAGGVVTSTETVVIGRSTPDVFAYTADLHNLPQWDVEVDTLTGPVGAMPAVGTSWAVRIAPFLGESAGTRTVAGVSSGVRVVLEADFVGMLTTVTYSYSSEAAGTRFTRQVDVTPPGMLKMMTPFVARRVKRANRRDLVNLKRVLEAA